MSTSARHQDMVGRTGDRRPIAVSRIPNEAVATRLLELADEHAWQLFDLTEYEGQLPTNLEVDGALVHQPPSSALVQSLLRRGVPTVRIGWMPLPEDSLVPAVLPDRPQVGRLASEHFAERGFKHVAYIAHPSWKFYRPTYRGLIEGARALGLQPHVRRMHGDRPEYARDSPEQWLYQQEDFTRSLRKFPAPVGLLASSDVTAGRYCRWILEAGLRVPEDVALLGIGNNRFLCESAPVHLSSVAYDWNRITDTAVRTLIRCMDRQPLEQHTILVPNLGVITRRSTDVLAAADDNVVRALRFMWEHVQQNLSVDQIATHVGVSRRSLERSFEHELGRGIFAEFQRRRLERAREMLLQTDLSVAAVSAAMGFSSPSYFCQAFSKTFGTSPARCREERRETNRGSADQSYTPRVGGISK